MAQIRVARDDHPVDATGPAMGLSNMVPAVPAIAQANGALRYPLVFIYWLILPIVHWGADIPGGTVLADFLVGVERCGTALERCILGGLDMSPCTISVARARIKRLGIRLFQLDPAPFTAMFADLYPTTPTPPVAGVVMPAAHPDTAAIALLMWFVANDDTFEPLADAEPVLQPRVNPPERVAGGGFDFFFTPAVAIIDARMPAALLALLPVIDRSRSAVDFISSRAPDPLLANLLNGGPARLAHVARLSQMEVLDSSNVDVALAHLDVLPAPRRLEALETNSVVCGGHACRVSCTGRRYHVSCTKP